MKNKKWLWIGSSILVVGVIGYIIYKRKKTSKTAGSTGTKSTETTTNQEGILTKVSNTILGGDSGEYVINTKLDAKGNFQYPQPKSGVDLKAKPLLNVVKCLDVKRLDIQPYYYSKNGEVWAYGSKEADTKLDFNIGKYVFIQIERLLSHLESKSKEDKSINEETRKYINALIQTFRGWFKTIFPESIYNANTTWYKEWIAKTKVQYDNYDKGCIK